MSATTLRLRRAALLAIALTFAFTLPACDSGGDEDPIDPPSTTGIINGRFSLQAGAGGSIDNARVAIYVTKAEFDNDNFLTTVAASSNGSFEFTNVNPGNYYIDVWKDNNNNRVIDTGDIYGFYSTGGREASPFSVVANQTTTINSAVGVARPAGNRSDQPALVGPPATRMASE